VTDASARLREVVERVSVDQLAVAKVNLQLAQLTAMAGDFDTARDLYRSSQAKLEELRAGIHALSTSLDAARVELLAGDHAAAEQLLRRDFDALNAVGEKYSLSSVAGLLAHAIERQGRIDEADEITRIAEEISAPDDLDAQALWRGGGLAHESLPAAVSMPRRWPSPARRLRCARRSIPSSIASTP